ncbi:hypothetical protein GQ600_25522 [Phytophthora cactorum]|nr:hypothetical protein GQ600_25522 [Phytophthora cactorum]
MYDRELALSTKMQASFYSSFIRWITIIELCLLPRARVIISTEKFCPRLRTPCRNEFCAKWQLHRAISGQASWTISLEVFTF